MVELDDTQFRDWLRTKLRARGMSIRLLAQRSGTSASTVSRILRAERRASLRTAIRLVRVLREASDVDDMARLLPLASVGHPLSEVERALRSDELLTPSKVRRIMLFYQALRKEDDEQPAAERRLASHS